MSASGIKAGRAYVEIGVNDKFTSALRAAQAKLKAFGAAVRTAGYAIEVAAAAAAVPLAASTKVFADVGSAVNDMSKRTGMSAEAVSELGFAAQMSGSDMETLEKGVRTMQRQLVEAANGGQAAMDAFAGLGLSVADLMAMSPERQFETVGKAIASLAEPAQRTAAAMELMGRGGAELVPVFEELDQLRGQARDFGISISAKDAAAADELGDAMDLARLSVRGLMMAIGKALAPAVTDVAKRIAGLVASAAKWIEKNRDVIVAAAKITLVASAVGSALVGLGVAISAAGAALGGVATLFGFAVKAALIAIVSPLGVVAGTVAACTAAFFLWSEAATGAVNAVKSRFSDMKMVAGEAIAGITAALRSGELSLAAQIATAGLKVVWKQLAADLKTIWLQLTSFFEDVWENPIAEVKKMFHRLAAEVQKAGVVMRQGWEQASSKWTDEIAVWLAQLDAKVQGAALTIEHKLGKHTEEEARAKWAVIEKDMQDSIDRIRQTGERDRETMPERHAAELLAAFKKIDDDLNTKIHDINTGAGIDPTDKDNELASAMAEYAEEVRKAKQELVFLSLQARLGEDIQKLRAIGEDIKAKAVGWFREVFGPKGPEIEQTKALLSGVFGTQGTFNARAIQSLQSVSGTGWKQLLEEQRRTNQTLGQIHSTQKQSSGGLTFGP